MEELLVSKRNVNLYVVYCVATQVVGPEVTTKFRSRCLVAVDGTQACAWISDTLMEEFPPEAGWRVETTPYRVDDRIIMLLIEEWGWKPVDLP